MKRTAWVLIAAIVGSGMSFIDGSAVNVALPVLQTDVHASAADVQWTVEGYALVLASLILVGGALGDAFGRRRIYAVGIALFALASLACSLAPEIHLLIAARCVQGLGGALATPGSLAIIASAFSGQARGRAIGTWSGAASITAALGPVIGGALVQYASWRAVFLINVPLALVVLFALTRVPESRDRAAARRIDLPGALLATGGLGTLVYGLIRLQATIADAPGIVCAGIGVVLLALFVLFEGRAPAPMMPLSLFASRAFSAANAYTFLLYAALGGSLYFVPFVLIGAQGYSPTAAGAAQLPFVVLVGACSRWSGSLAARFGARRPLVAGAVLAAAGFALFARPGLGESYWTSYFPASCALGAGGVFFIAPLTTLVMDAAGAEHSGIASGINNAVSRAASLIAVAALGVVPARVAGPANLDPGAQHAAYLAGFRAVMLLSAGLALAAGALAFATVPGVRHSRGRS
jgi:EmrB/QacA subfamily drug resistance transporter